jgi:hypothetical protein
MSTAPTSSAAAPGAKRPSLRVRLVAYLLMTVVSVGSLTWVARVVKRQWTRDMQWIEASIDRDSWPHGAYFADPEVGFRPTPDFSGTMLDKSFHVRTDKLGSRIPTSARPDVLEPNGVLAVGCSFTYGYDVEAEQAFPYVIGQLLEIPAYNFGVCAYSYATAVLLVKQLEREGTLARLAPQFLVLGAGSWLEDRSRSPFYPTASLPFTYPYLRDEDGRAVVARAPSVIDVRHALAAVDSGTGYGTLVPRVWFARMYGRTLPNPGSQATLKDEAIYEFVLGELGDVARRHNMRLAILWLPHHDVEAVNPRLVQVLPKHPDVILIDGNAAMRDEHVPAPEFADRHPSAKAHAGYARHVAEILRPFKRAESRVAVRTDKAPGRSVGQ